MTAERGTITIVVVGPYVSPGPGKKQMVHSNGTNEESLIRDYLQRQGQEKAQGRYSLKLVIARRLSTDQGKNDYQNLESIAVGGGHPTRAGIFHEAADPTDCS